MPTLSKTLSRHLIGLMLAAIAIIFIPNILNLIDNTGESASKLQNLSFFKEPFKLAGGVLFLTCLHLYLLVWRDKGKAN